MSYFIIGLEIMMGLCIGKFLFDILEEAISYLAVRHLPREIWDRDYQKHQVIIEMNKDKKKTGRVVIEGFCRTNEK